MFGSLGPTELILILVIVALLFGGKKIPEFARGLGKSIAEFKEGMRELENTTSATPSSPDDPED